MSKHRIKKQTAPKPQHRRRHVELAPARPPDPPPEPNVATVPEPSHTPSLDPPSIQGKALMPSPAAQSCGIGLILGTVVWTWCLLALITRVPLEELRPALPDVAAPSRKCLIVVGVTEDSSRTPTAHVPDFSLLVTMPPAPAPIAESHANNAPPSASASRLGPSLPFNLPIGPRGAALPSEGSASAIWNRTGYVDSDPLPSAVLAQPAPPPESSSPSRASGSSYLGTLRRRVRGFVSRSYGGYVAVVGFVRISSDSASPAGTFARRQRRLPQEEAHRLRREKKARGQERWRRMVIGERKRRRIERQKLQLRRKAAGEVYIRGVWHLYLAQINGQVSRWRINTGCGVLIHS